MKNIFENASVGKATDIEIVLPIASGPGPEPVHP